MELNLPLYSAYLGAFLIVLQTLLAATVGLYRGRNRKGIGHQDDATLERKIRRHANMTEYAPLYLSVLALYELIAGQSAVILWLAIAFAAGRLLHAIGFSSLAGSHLDGAQGPRFLFVLARMIGTALTLLPSFAVAGFLVGHLTKLA